MIRHIVVWKLKGEDAAEKHESAERIRGLLEGLRPVISEIKELRVSENRVDIDRNWDLVLVADYESPADLQAYLVHPDHVKVAQLIGTMIVERSAIDVEV
jgi:Stress responsive A/B Barrel Domain